MRKHAIQEHIRQPLQYAEDEVEGNIMGAFVIMPCMVRVWSPGSDHSSELTEVNATLADLTDQLGTRTFRRGTPQRARLDARIEALSTRQAELSRVLSSRDGKSYVFTKANVAAIEKAYLAWVKERAATKKAKADDAPADEAKPSSAPRPVSPAPKVGVGLIGRSHDGDHAATRNQGARRGRRGL